MLQNQTIKTRLHTHQIVANLPAPTYYVFVPKNLISELRDSPVAIAIYALIARLYRLRREAIPVSAKDLIAYDPQLSYGAATRGLQRLVEGGWVISDRGRSKTRYLPTWGIINEIPRVWDASEANLGRPRHIKVIKLDQNLLDVGLGRFEPSLQHTALIERYMQTPPISLRTIGWYSLALIGITTGFAHLSETGLVTENQLQSVPSETEWLCGMTDPCKVPTNQLTAAGYERLGVAICSEAHPAQSQCSVFFVPPSRIAIEIADEIAHKIVPISDGMIGHTTPPTSIQTQNLSSESVKTASASHKENLFGSHGIMQESESMIQPRTVRSSNETPVQAEKSRPKTKHQFVVAENTPEIPSLNPESVELLEKLRMRPRMIRELGSTDPRDIRAAMIDVKNRPEIRDKNGWIIYLLRQLREDGWAPWRDNPNYGMDKSQDPVLPVTSYAPILTHPGVELHTRLEWINKFSSALPLDRGKVIDEFLNTFAYTKTE